LQAKVADLADSNHWLTARVAEIKKVHLNSDLSWQQRHVAIGRILLKDNNEVETAYEILERDRQVVCEQLCKKEAALRAAEKDICLLKLQLDRRTDNLNVVISVKNKALDENKRLNEEYDLIKHVLTERTDALLEISSKLRSTRGVVEEARGVVEEALGMKC
jgi:uncharacterized protein YhaN